LIGLSTRWAWVASLLLALIAFPAWLWAPNPGGDDCASPMRLFAEHVAPESSEGRRTREKLDVFQWIDGPAPSPPNATRPSRFRLVRSWESNRFYFEQSDFLYANPFPSDEIELRWATTGDGEIPYYVRHDNSEGLAAVSAYLILFGGRPVVHPFLESVADAGSQLTGGAKPTTLILFDGATPLDHKEEMLASAEAWLVEAWGHYRDVCSPPAAG
jgi:hypothetical protein